MWKCVLVKVARRVKANHAKGRPPSPDIFFRLDKRLERGRKGMGEGRNGWTTLYFKQKISAFGIWCTIYLSLKYTDIEEMNCQTAGIALLGS